MTQSTPTDLQQALRSDRDELAAAAATLDDAGSRAVLAQAIRAVDAPTPRITGIRVRRSRLAPLAVGSLLVAGALTAAIALQPSAPTTRGGGSTGTGTRTGTGTSSTPRTTPATHGQHPRITPRAGALAALRLQDASAAEVLLAAGSSASAAAPAAPGANWGYHRVYVKEGTSPSYRVSEIWTNLDDGSTWMLDHNTYSGRVIDEFIIGHRRNDGDDGLFVAYSKRGGALVETRRDEQLDQGVALQEEDVRALYGKLAGVHTAAQARAALEDALDSTIRGDFVCENDALGACISSGGNMGLGDAPRATGPATDVGTAEWERNARSVIAQGMISTALPSDATAALYELLAQMQGATVVGTVDTGRGAPGVGIRFPGQAGVIVKKPGEAPQADPGDLWVFDRRTGQLAAVIPGSDLQGYREWTEQVALAAGPGDKSLLCREEPALCTAFDDLVAYVAADPKWTGPSGTTRSNDIPAGEPGSDATLQR